MHYALMYYINYIIPITSYMHFNVYYVITSGLPLDFARIDGLSALFIHEQLRIEMVMEAFVHYMAFVKDKFHPSKAYVDATWFTEKDAVENEKELRSPVRVVFNMYF